MKRSLSDADVKEVRDLHARGFSFVEISRMLSVSRSTVEYAVKRMGAYREDNQPEAE